ncbi:hypothetical protein [Mesobacillus harenae]|uniref:hypothetical protein n=1 Tax=Mesobacillus harenae TaxID=2213203 RepID=UPI00158004E5|nr:hypothetical protein [Mesobacillus harenae]
MGDIRIRTLIPGPLATKLLERKGKNVPQGPFNTLQTFAAKGRGALLTNIDGNTLIDFPGAIGTLILGTVHPR